MPILLEAKGIQKSYGSKKLLDFPALTLYTGDKIGLIGANGSGKSTLLQILLGEKQPDQGEVRKYCEIGYIPQFGRSEQGGGEKGLLSRFQAAEVSPCPSGGEEARLKIAAAFSQPRPLLFADEPTANLDGEGTALFAQYLARAESFVLISHDRRLLDQLCNQILCLEEGNLRLYPGNFSAYQEQKEGERQSQALAYQHYIGEKERLSQAVKERAQMSGGLKKTPSRMGNSEARLHKRKTGEKQQKISQAQKSLESRLARLEKPEKPRQEPVMALDFSLTQPPENRMLIQGAGLTFAYGKRPILEQAAFTLPRGSKTALYGSNGCGKTTLLRLIAAGYPGISLAPRVRLGIFRQDISTLNPEKTVLENALENCIQSPAIARNILARLLFTRESLNKKAALLSGGERVKLALAQLLLSPANLLILDEPTNYLDIPSLEALEKILREYAGALLFVSHDRAFIQGIATRLLIFEGQKLITFEGSLAEYEERQKNPANDDAAEKTRLQIRLTQIDAALAELSPKEEEEKARLEQEYFAICRALKALG